MQQRLIQRLRHLICPFEPLIEAMPEGKRVLDIGCGTGALLLRTAQEGKVREGVGIDVFEPALAQARSAWAEQQPSKPDVKLEFFRHQSPAELEGVWETVLMVDVIHHVPVPAQESFMRAAMRRVAPGGRMIYKDMCSRPLWKRSMNRLHDLVMARQWIHELPLESVKRWSAEEGLVLASEQHYSRVWYGHELLILDRPASMSS
jgi:2-polyprenyl-3-methyl-5-hydroxy-6-metoxy-1,4-benzoquinol methylase